MRDDRPTAELIVETERLDREATKEPWEIGNGTADHTGHGPYFLMAKEIREWFVLAEFNQSCAYVGDLRLASRYRVLAPELARRLRDADQELRDVRSALEVGSSGDPIEAIEELQQQAARVPELRRQLDAVTVERDRLRCDLARGQG